MFLANTWEDYEVLDTGDGEKLERWGECHSAAAYPQTIWPKADPALWKQAQAHYHRSEKGGGEWEFLTRLPERWTIQHQDLRFYVRPTGFKHTGLFPEQAANWVWMGDLIRNSGRKDIRVLNLFGYTGGATLACAGGGRARHPRRCGEGHGSVGARRTASYRSCRRKPQPLDRRGRAAVRAAGNPPRQHLRRHPDGSAVATGAGRRARCGSWKTSCIGLVDTTARRYSATSRCSSSSTATRRAFRPAS